MAHTAAMSNVTPCLTRSNSISLSELRFIRSTSQRPLKSKLLLIRGSSPQQQRPKRKERYPSWTRPLKYQNNKLQLASAHSTSLPQLQPVQQDPDKITQQPYQDLPSVLRLKRQPSSSLTTLQQNLEIQLQLSTLASAQQHAKQKQQSCSELISRCHKDYKAMCYSLTRLVVSDDSKHILLTPGWQSIEVVAQTPMYFKINVYQRQAPCVVQLQYAPHQQIRSIQQLCAGKQLVDLRVFYSATTKEPSEHSCFRAFNNPSKQVVLAQPNPRSDQFESPFVYLTFVSDSGCQIQTNVQFRGDPQPCLKRKQQKLKQEEEQTLDSSPVAQPPKLKSIIQKTKPLTRSRPTHLKLLKQAQHCKVRLNFQLQQSQKHKLKQFLAVKWDILKQLKQRLASQACQRAKVNQIKQWYRSNLTLVQLLHLVYANFTQLKQLRFAQATKLHVANTVRVVWLKFKQRQVKPLLHIRNSLQLLHQCNHQRTQAHTVLHTFLTELKKLHDLQALFRSLSRKLTQLQRTIKKRLESKYARQQAYTELLEVQLASLEKKQQKPEAKAHLKLYAQGLSAVVMLLSKLNLVFSLKSTTQDQFYHDSLTVTQSTLQYKIEDYCELIFDSQTQCQELLKKAGSLEKNQKMLQLFSREQFGSIARKMSEGKEQQLAEFMEKQDAEFRELQRLLDESFRKQRQCSQELSWKLQKAKTI